MQEHSAKKLRVSILLWLMLLALVFPYAVDYYEQQQAFQWEEMVQPHWEVELVPRKDIGADRNAVVANRNDPVAARDVPEWKDLDVEFLPEPEQEKQQQIPEPPLTELPPVTPSPPVTQTPVVTITPPVIPKTTTAKKTPTPTKLVVTKKKSGMTLKLPENLHQGQVAEWEEKKPLVVPDFFAPKKEGPSRYQFSGRLIVDEDKKKEQPDASYLDSVKGAEINISISTD
jgi:hypothetical protein